MTGTKYIGMDVHKESISSAVMNGLGKIVMESVIETKASTILQFIQGLHGELHVTFEEGTWAAWLYDLLRPHVNRGCWCAIRAQERHMSARSATRMTASMHASWPSCCALETSPPGLSRRARSANL